MCLQSRYTAAYDSQLLTVMSELLVSFAFKSVDQQCTVQVVL